MIQRTKVEKGKKEWKKDGKSNERRINKTDESINVSNKKKSRKMKKLVKKDEKSRM